MKYFYALGFLVALSIGLALKAGRNEDIQDMFLYIPTSSQPSTNSARLDYLRELLNKYKGTNSIINEKDKSGATALMSAIRAGNLNAVKLLLGYPDIKINETDDEGRTALMDATAYTNSSYVKLLLNYPKIDIGLKDKEGRTALDIARNPDYQGEGNKNIEILLLKHQSSKSVDAFAQALATIG